MAWPASTRRTSARSCRRRQRLGADWPELRAAIVEVFERHNVADDGTVAVRAGYLVTVARKPA